MTYWQRLKKVKHDVFEMGRELRKMPLKTKTGHILTSDEIFNILIKEFHKHDDVDEIFMGLMNFETGFHYFYTGFIGKMPYELKNNWQKKRSLRQQRSIQNTSNLSVPILP